MKVTSYHLAILSNCIKKMMVKKELNKETINDSYQDHSEELKLWAIFRNALAIDPALIWENFKEYDDSHILTALKHIWKNI